MAQCTAKVEFIVAKTVANEACWPRKVLLDLNLKQKECIEVLVDN